MRVDNLTTVWTVLFTRPGRYHWMFQYYLRAEGLALSWVGTGRCLFSLDWKEDNYNLLLQRMLVACEEMKKGGWWAEPKVNVKSAVGKEFAVAIIKSFLPL